MSLISYQKALDICERARRFLYNGVILDDVNILHFDCEGESGDYILIGDNHANSLEDGGAIIYHNLSKNGTCIYIDDSCDGISGQDVNGEKVFSIIPLFTKTPEELLLTS
jgi:hypothetical protein